MDFQLNTEQKQIVALVDDLVPDRKPRFLKKNREQ